MMKSIDDKIIEKIKKCGKGFVFFSSDFITLGSKKSVNKVLERLCNSDTIIRIARGIYCYPKTNKILGIGIVYPTSEEIAYAVAKRDKVRLVPSGDYALNKLGLSQQVPMNIVFYTDGSSRKIKLYNDKYIQFKHIAPKNLAFQSELAMLITFAFKEIGKEQVNEYYLDKLSKILHNIDKKSIERDYKLMPDWIRTLIIRCYE